MTYAADFQDNFYTAVLHHRDDYKKMQKKELP
jgi:hypothetical protein